MHKIAIYPGSFDPITYGHLDILQRACKVFNTVIVAIGKNTSKNNLFTTQQRISLINACVQNLPQNVINNVKIMQFNGLLIDFAKQQNAIAIVRGIRTLSDFEFEFNLAGLNAKLNNSIETMFLLASEDKQFISSRFVVDIASFGGDVSGFVPPVVKQALVAKFAK